MHIHQLILHGCSNALHLEMDFDPGGSVIATRTSGGRFLRNPPSALDILGEDSYWSLRLMRGDDWDSAALLKSAGAIARTHPRRPIQPLVRQGDLTLLNLEQVFFDPTTLDCEDMELFFPENTGYLLRSLRRATQMGLATAVQADAGARLLYKDTRFVYRDGHTGVWYVVFWGVDPGFEQIFLPQPTAMPEMPSMIAPFLASFF